MNRMNVNQTTIVHARQLYILEVSMFKTHVNMISRLHDTMITGTGNVQNGQNRGKADRTTELKQNGSQLELQEH